jgi:hypothetical protein
VVDYYVTPTELTDKKLITCLNFGDKLLVQAGEAVSALGVSAGDVVASTDGDTFIKDSGGTYLDILWSLPIGTFLGPAAAPWGELAPYFFTETDLYVLRHGLRALYYQMVITSFNIHLGHQELLDLSAYQRNRGSSKLRVGVLSVFMV